MFGRVVADGLDAIGSAEAMDSALVCPFSRDSLTSSTTLESMVSCIHGQSHLSRVVFVFNYIAFTIPHSIK
jgi:hypothetical protein